MFFLSSRRRHTRWPRDWSSDVCSSDLPAPGRVLPAAGSACWAGDRGAVDLHGMASRCHLLVTIDGTEIGRATCRERGWNGGGEKRKNNDRIDEKGSERM